MNTLTLYSIYAAVFLAALLLVEGVYYAFFADRAADAAVNRRMRLSRGTASKAAVLDKLRRKAQRGPARFMHNPVAWLETLLIQTGSTLSPAGLAMRMALLSVGLFVVALWIGPGLSANVAPAAAAGAAMVAGIAGVAGPVVVLMRKRARRMKQFSEQLPDALDVMVRSLRAGHPISAALALVAREMPDPVGSEFGIAVDEMTYGLGLRDALANLGDRVGLTEYEYVIAAINVQDETGGNLAEVLNGVASVMRDRFRLFKKVKALSAEGKWSAIVLCVLPPFTVGFILLTSPSYYADGSGDPLFWPIMGGAMGLLLLGIAVMYRMVNFRV